MQLRLDKQAKQLKQRIESQEKLIIIEEMKVENMNSYLTETVDKTYV